MAQNGQTPDEIVEGEGKSDVTAIQCKTDSSGVRASGPWLWVHGAWPKHYLHNVPVGSCEMIGRGLPWKTSPRNKSGHNPLLY